MAERTPGGLFLVDPETRDELSRPPRDDLKPLPATAAGERFVAHASSPYFVTDADAWICELWDPAVIVLADPLADAALIVSPLETLAREGRSFLIAAPSITGDALVFLIANKLRGILTCGAIDADAATLARIATHTGTMMNAAAHGRAKRITIAHGELAIAV